MTKNKLTANDYNTMNILILQGSPRAKGNTAWMAEEYKNAAVDEQKTEATKQKIVELVKKL